MSRHTHQGIPCSGRDCASNPENRTPRKVRPGRITDGMVEAFGRGAHGHAEARGAELCIVDGEIRAGLVAALTRRELERRTEPQLHPINLDPYPATVGEVADEIARFVLELEDGPARGVAGMVRERLEHARVSKCADAAFRPADSARGPKDQCTHGADCQVHPDVRQLHNLV